MPNADYTPDLSSLEQDYQILTELHRSSDSRTYLARHLGLNRDVTVTVVHATDTAGYQMLTQYAADARILAKARHPNIIPVIEGRQLSHDTFAVVRARVRGSTLNQLVGEVGPLPLPRGALQNIYSALEWARKGGIVHRRVSPDDVVFQQGSGRVLLAFDPAIPLGDATWDRCADARTIGRLAWEMLAGRPSDNPDAKTLAELRPDLPTRIIEETVALMNCKRDAAPPNVPAYIMLLGAPPSVLASNMSATRMPVPPSAIRSTPLGKTDDAVLVVKQGLGFNARVALAAAVLAVIVLVALLLVNRNGSGGSLVAPGGQASDSMAQAAGDVDRASRPDTMVPVASPPAVAHVVTPPATIVAASPPRDTDSSRRAQGESLLAPPTERRHEPGRPTTPPLTMPNVPPPTDTTAPAQICGSPAPSDQRSCLKAAIQQGDVPVNRVYRQLIAALRAQAGVQDSEPDPPSVTQLRETQTKWLGDRDMACGNVGIGPLYATERAQCYADQSAKRMRELRDMLDEIPRL